MANPNDLMIRNIANNEYTLQIRELIATQNTDDSPLIMRGPGEIKFDAKGRLNLSCHLIKSDEIKAHELSWSGEPGIITPDNEYFDIEFHDYSGDTWKAKKTSIQQTLTLIGAEPGYCTGSLRKISSTKETANTNQFFQLFFPKNQSFIGELKTKISEDSKHVTVSTIKTKNLNIEIAEHLSHLGVTVTSEKNLTRKTIDSVTSALSITFGIELTPFLTISQSDGKYTKEILQHKKNAETSLLTPIFQPRINTKETLTLIEKLIDFIDSNDTPIYRLWYKNHQAFQAGLDVFSLSICTTIESLINIHLTKYKSPEKQFAELASSAIPKIESLEIDPSIKERLINSLKSANQKSAKNAVFSIANEHNIPEELPKAWHSLRNAVAHGTVIENSQIKLQKFVHEAFCCESLFYKLIMICIDYQECYSTYIPGKWGNSVPESK